MNKSILYVLVLLIIAYVNAWPQCVSLNGNQNCSDHCRLHIIGNDGSRPKGGHCSGLTCVCDY